jgi:hypothetical protein
MKTQPRSPRSQEAIMRFQISIVAYRFDLRSGPSPRQVTFTGWPTHLRTHR